MRYTHALVLIVMLQVLCVKGDTLQLKNGKTIEGKILIESTDRIVIEEANGKRTIMMAEVASIYRGTPATQPTTQPGNPTTQADELRKMRLALNRLEYEGRQEERRLFVAMEKARIEYEWHAAIAQYHQDFQTWRDTVAPQMQPLLSKLDRIRAAGRAAERARDSAASAYAHEKWQVERDYLFERHEALCSNSQYALQQAENRRALRIANLVAVYEPQIQQNSQEIYTLDEQQKHVQREIADIEATAPMKPDRKTFEATTRQTMSLTEVLRAGGRPVPPEPDKNP